MAAQAALPMDVAGGPGRSGAQHDSRHGWQKAPCRGQRPGTRVRQRRPSADYGRRSAPSRGQLGAGSKHLRTKDRRAFLPGSQPQGHGDPVW